jgi:hypothetical protein
MYFVFGMVASCTALVLLIEIVSYVGGKGDLREGNDYKRFRVHSMKKVKRIAGITCQLPAFPTVF